MLIVMEENIDITQEKKRSQSVCTNKSKKKTRKVFHLSQLLDMAGALYSNTPNYFKEVSSVALFLN